MTQKQQNNQTFPSEAAEMARRSRHPAERPLSILSALITVLMLIFLGWNLTYSVKTPAEESAAIATLSQFLEVDEESAALMMKAQAWIVLVVFVFVYFRYWFSLFNETNRAAGEDLTCKDLKSHLPQEIMDRYVQILGMKNPPTLYFSDSGNPVTINDVEAYGTGYIVLSAKLFTEEEMDEKLTDLHFRLATKLGNIYMGYNNIFSRC